MSGCRSGVEVRRAKSVFNLARDTDRRPVRQMAEMYANAGMIADLELLYNDHSGLWNPRQPSMFALTTLLLAYCNRWECWLPWLPRSLHRPQAPATILASV